MSTLLNKSTDYQAIDITRNDMSTIRGINLTYQVGNTPVNDIKYTPLYMDIMLVLASLRSQCYGSSMNFIFLLTAYTDLDMLYNQYDYPYIFNVFCFLAVK